MVFVFVHTIVGNGWWSNVAVTINQKPVSVFYLVNSADAFPGKNPVTAGFISEYGLNMPAGEIRTRMVCAGEPSCFWWVRLKDDNAMILRAYPHLAILR